jgi:chromosome segregation ATPase
VSTMTMGERPTWQPPAWLQKLVFGTLPPDPGPTQAQQIAELVTGQTRLQAQADTLTRALSETREDLAQARGYAEMLNNITKRQDGELQSLSSALSDTQAQLRQAIEDKQFQANRIADLRSQMTGQSAEIAELRSEIARLREELATTRNQAQIEAAKARILNDENTMFRQQVAALTKERDHLLAELERWQQGA